MFVSNVGFLFHNICFVFLGKHKMKNELKLFKKKNKMKSFRQKKKYKTTNDYFIIKFAFMFSLMK